MWPSTAKWLNDLKACKHIFAEENSSVAAPLFKLCERRQGIAGVKGNQLQLMTESDDVMQALIRDIQLARHNIEMVFYIWQPGGMADQVAESLMAAARRGIHCRLMLDSAGSVAFFRSPWPELMRNAGIEVVEALKVNLMRVFLRRMDLRQHRKMIMIDNYIAYTGSMNMVDPRYFKQDAGVGQWIDLMARMEGPIATAMGIIYSCDWEIETGKRILPPPPDVNIMPFEQASGHTIHTIASGPGFPEDLIHQALLTAAYSAREYLIMTTPTLCQAMIYFMRFARRRSAGWMSVLSFREKMTRCWSAGPVAHSLRNCWLLGLKFISLKAGYCIPRACWSMAN